MKKKFASLVALSAALTLAFGMTVSAAGSTSTPSTNVSETALEQAAKAVTTDSVTVTGAGVGQQAEVVVTAQEITTGNVGAAEETLAGQLKNADITQKQGGLVTGFDLSITVDGDPAENITVKFPVSGVVSSGTYRILHFKDGAWEILIPKKVEAGYLTATFTSLSPIVVIEVAKVEKDGENGNPAPAPQQPAANATPATPAAPAAPVAPKTGEALPIAGLMLVICLAGAALCTKKARI